MRCFKMSRCSKVITRVPKVFDVIAVTETHGAARDPSATVRLADWLSLTVRYPVNGQARQTKWSGDIGRSNLHDNLQIVVTSDCEMGKSRLAWFFSFPSFEAARSDLGWLSLWKLTVAAAAALVEWTGVELMSAHGCLRPDQNRTSLSPPVDPWCPWGVERLRVWLTWSDDSPHFLLTQFSPPPGEAGVPGTPGGGGRQDWEHLPREELHQPPPRECVRPVLPGLHGAGQICLSVRHRARCESVSGGGWGGWSHDPLFSPGWVKFYISSECHQNYYYQRITKPAWFTSSLQPTMQSMTRSSWQTRKPKQSTVSPTNLAQHLKLSTLIIRNNQPPSPWIFAQGNTHVQKNLQYDTYYC